MFIQKCHNCPKKCTPDGIMSSAQDLKKLIDCTEIEDNLIISSLQLSGGKKSYHIDVGPKFLNSMIYII